MTQTFSTPEISAMFGITPRRLQWLDEQGILTATRVKGGYRSYDLRAAVLIGILDALRKHALTLKPIRAVLKSLQRHPRFNRFLLVSPTGGTWFCATERDVLKVIRQLSQRGEFTLLGCRQAETKAPGDGSGSVMEQFKIKTEGDMVLALRDYYAAPEYVLLPQVRNGAGFSATRTIDALAMSVWPSRGLHLTGIEIKVSRSDWLRELRNPKKADEVAEYCDFWVLAVGDESIVQEGELPATWGLLVPGKRPGALKLKSPLTKLEAKIMSRSFLAAVLRTTLETVVPLASVDAEIERRVTERVAVLEKSITDKIAKDLDRDRLLKRNQELEAAHKSFQEMTGLGRSYGYGPEEWKRVSATMQLLRWGGLAAWIDDLERSADRVKQNLRDLRKALPKEQAPEESAA